MLPQAWSRLERGEVRAPHADTLSRVAKVVGDDAVREENHSSYVLRLWDAMGPTDREAILSEMVRRAVPGSFDSADELLQAAAL